VRITVLGNGGFGTAMALVARSAGHEVRLWGHDSSYTQEIACTRRNPRYLDGVDIPPEVLVTADSTEALATTAAILVAVPTQHIRTVMESVLRDLPESVPLVSLAKGLEQSTCLRPSQVIGEVVGSSQRVLVLSGPSHAEEVAHGLPATLVLAGSDPDAVELLQVELSTPSFRIYRNRDLLGVELCGALKNVMALAAGIAEGLNLGDNAKAAILSRGIVEMARFGVAEGAERGTFYGLAGMGDLAVTAFSRHGRNRAFGERIGRGETLDEILASTHKVAEGVWTSRVVRERAQKIQVDMPLCEAVCRVLFEGEDPLDVVRQLMERDHKDEVVR
jgi:glycerol-3-phosphate dehydrogenase (NAD(P)+)